MLYQHIEVANGRVVRQNTVEVNPQAHVEREQWANAYREGCQQDTNSIMVKETGMVIASVPGTLYSINRLYCISEYRSRHPLVMSAFLPDAPGDEDRDYELLTNVFAASLLRGGNPVPVKRVIDDILMEPRPTVVTALMTPAPQLGAKDVEKAVGLGIVWQQMLVLGVGSLAL